MRIFFKVISIISLSLGVLILGTGLIISFAGLGEYAGPIYDFFNNNFIGWIIIGVLIVLGLVGITISFEIFKKEPKHQYNPPPYEGKRPDSDYFDYGEDKDDPDYKKPTYYEEKSPDEFELDPDLARLYEHGEDHVTLIDENGNEVDVNASTGLGDDGNHYNHSSFSDSWYRDD